MALYRPAFQAQLIFGIPTKGEDCAVRSGSMAVDFATRGARVPAVRDFRRRAGQPEGGLRMEQVSDAIRSYDTPAETGGYRDLRTVYHRASDWSQALDALERGWFVVFAIDYAWLNRYHPKKSGDPAFMGKHAIGGLGIRVRDGARQSQVYDPLCDGRRPGIPEGPKWWDLSILRGAADSAYAGSSFTGVVIPPSKRLQEGSE